MLPLPPRLSLVTWTTSALREQLLAGTWQDFLPGELQLCQRLQVSRSTLRAALAALETEGLLRTSQGRRREIAGPQPRKPAPSKPLPCRVVLLTPVPHAGLTAARLLWMDALRAHLDGRGISFEVLVSAAAAGNRPERVLRALTRQHPDAAWVLLRSTARMQHWFASQKLPVVVAGSRYPGTVLAGVDTDYQATGRHATGRLIARGCSRLGLVVPRNALAGDGETESGFRAGAAGRPVQVARHDGTPDGLCRVLDILMKGKLAPDGLLVCDSTHAVTTLGHLIRRGWQVPRQIRLISRDDDPFLQHVVPAISRYEVPPETYARQVARQLRRCLEGTFQAPGMHLLLPRFHEGQTA